MPKKKKLTDEAEIKPTAPLLPEETVQTVEVADESKANEAAETAETVATGGAKTVAETAEAAEVIEAPKAGKAAKAKIAKKAGKPKSTGKTKKTEGTEEAVDPQIISETASEAAVVPEVTEVAGDADDEPKRTDKRSFRQAIDHAINYAILLALIAALAGTIYVAQTNRMPLPIAKAEQAVNDYRSKRAIARQKQQTDNLFRAYLTKLASSKGLYLEEAYDGTMNQVGGSTGTGKRIYDAKKRQADENVEISCNARGESNSYATLDMTLQTTDTTDYVRFNRLSGKIVEDDGTVLEPGLLSSRLTGKWVKLPEASQGTPQVQKEVVIFEGGVIAPGRDTAKLVNALLAHKAFEYYEGEKDGDNFTFNVNVKRDAYLAAVRESLPDLDKPDLMIQNLFEGEADTTSIKLKVAPDGSFVSQEHMMNDFCAPLVQAFFGNSVQTPSDMLNETLTAKPFGSLSIPPVDSIKAAAGAPVTL